MSTDHRHKLKYNVTSISEGGNTQKWQGRKESPTPPSLSSLWADQSHSVSPKCGLLLLPLLLLFRFTSKSVYELRLNGVKYKTLYSPILSTHLNFSLLTTGDPIMFLVRV